MNEENSSKLVQEFAQRHKTTKQQKAGTGVCCLSGGGRHSPTLGIDARSLGKMLSMASSELESQKTMANSRGCSLS